MELREALNAPRQTEHWSAERQRESAAVVHGAVEAAVRKGALRELRSEGAEQDIAQVFLVRWFCGELPECTGNAAAYLRVILVRMGRDRLRKRRRALDRQIRAQAGDERDPLDGIASDAPAVADTMEEAEERGAVVQALEGALDAYAEHLEQGGVRADVRRSDPEFIALHRRLARFETTLSDYYEQTCSATPGLVRNTLQKRVSKFRQRFIAFVHAKQDECSDDATVWSVAAEVMERLREAGARTGALPRGSQ
jgi:DNA-directed RNA polymerase specialized sigma24 family protein